MSHLHTGGLEAFTGSIPFVGGHRNGKVMMPTKHFLIVTETKSRHVKKGQAIAVTDVEEEVCASRVVTVLEEFGERKAKKPLIKDDGLFDI